MSDQKVNDVGDWGLGIGDWANPPSPIPHPLLFVIIVFLTLSINNIKL